MTVSVCRQASGVAEGCKSESYVYLSKSAKCAVRGRDEEKERLQRDVQLNLKFGRGIISYCVIHQRLLFDGRIRVPGITVTGMICCRLRQVFADTPVGCSLRLMVDLQNAFTDNLLNRSPTETGLDHCCTLAIHHYDSYREDLFKRD